MYYHANNPTGGATSPSAPVSEKRFIKMGHACLGVSNGSSLTLTGADRHDSLLWSRQTDKPAGTAHSWSPYGSGSPADASLPGFNGERIDPVSGTYHLGNGYRAYNPVLMRFNCPDSLSPFGAGGINPYAYCAGDPVNHTDPSGHLSWQAILGIALGAIGLAAAIFTGGMSVVAAGSVAAALGSASTSALVIGGIGVVADVTAIASGAMEDSDPSASSILGWVSLATGAIGAAIGIGMDVRAFMKAGVGKTKIRSSAGGFGKRDVQINLHPEKANPVQFSKAFGIQPIFLPNGKIITYNTTAYLNNFRGTGNPGLLVHGNIKGTLGIYPGIKLSVKHRYIDFHNAEQFIAYLDAHHSIKLFEHDGEPLHLLACYIGRGKNTPQNLANTLGRPVTTHSGYNQILMIEPIRNHLGKFKNGIYNFPNIFKKLSSKTYYPDRLNYLNNLESLENLY